MKKIILLFYLLFGCIHSFYGQDINKKFNLSGNVNFNVRNVDDENDVTIIEERTLNLSPRLGYFITESVELGLGIEFTKGQENDYDVNAFSFGPYLRKYLDLGKSFYLFGEAGVNFSKFKRQKDNDTTKREQLTVGISPGIMYHMVDWLAFEVGLDNIIGYSIRKEMISDPILRKVDDTNFQMSLNLNSFNFGFNIFFGKRQD